MALLDAKGLKKHFRVKRDFFSKSESLKAVDGVDLSIREGRVFSLVGESGCGKSTLARLLLKLVEPTAGNVLFKGKDVFGLRGDALKRFRRAVQIIFQDPFASLNPRMTVFETLSEPLKIHGIVGKSGMREKVVGLLSSVGLKPDALGRYPHEFSGGQRQRICIARALAVSPEVIVADEPLSALDVSIQAQILNILQTLKAGSGISFFFISHDLRVVRYLSDDVAVMYLGKVVEESGAEGLFENPLHPYTEVLLDSAPGLKPGGRKKTVPKGDVPSPIDIPPGCPYHPRCPKRFEPCDKAAPELKAVEKEGGRLVACHLVNPV